MTITFAEVYHTQNKGGWGLGEWTTEPDKAVWIDPNTGLDCMIVRNHYGALCGYVGVTDDHSLYGKDYETPDVSVHGGLTFADACTEGSDPSNGICHISPNKVWWFGFDCAHAFDLAPALQNYSSKSDVYKNFPYVIREVTSLARQLNEVK